MFEDVEGTAFPFRIDPVTGGVAMASGSDKIRQNVRIILGTNQGERPMQRDFGTRIPALVHEPNDGVLSELLQIQARQALLQWEPRILVDTLQIEQDGGDIQMRVNYIYTGEQVADQMLIQLG